MEGNGICCGDTFNLSYTGLGPTGFTILAVRSDTQSGWGQEIKVDYEVVDSAAALLETNTVTLTRHVLVLSRLRGCFRACADIGSLDVVDACWF